MLRKQCQYHFTNLLCAIAYHPYRLRSCDEFLPLPDTEQGNFFNSAYFLINSFSVHFIVKLTTNLGVTYAKNRYQKFEPCFTSRRHG